MCDEDVERPLPNRLYKYQPLTVRTLSSLRNRQVWFGRPASFNDPFDCALAVRVEEPSSGDLEHLLDQYRQAAGDDAQDPVEAGYVDRNGVPTEAFRRMAVANAKQQLEDFAQETRTARGVTCFSERADDILLWSHYGGGHRGFCLGFDTNTPLFAKAYPVTYASDLPAMTLTDLLSASKAASTAWLRSVLTKAPCWSYEREWRVVHEEPDRPFTYDWRSLDCIYFGAMMDEAHKEMIALILRGSPTKLLTVRHRTDQFTLEAAPIEFTPYDYDSDR